MELKQYLSALWKWSWLVALATAIAGGASFWATSRMPRIYETSTTLMVGQSIQAINPTSQDLHASQTLAKSYVELARRRGVLGGALEALGIEMSWGELARNVFAAPRTGTQLIEIAVRDTDPKRAKALADEIARQLILQSPTPPEQQRRGHGQFVNQELDELQRGIADARAQIATLNQRLASAEGGAEIGSLSERIAVLEHNVTRWRADYIRLLDFVRGSRSNHLAVVETAAVPGEPVSPRPARNVLLACAIGFLLSLGGVMLLEYLDDTLKSAEDVERIVDLPTLGTIGRIPAIQKPHNHMVATEHPFSPLTEAYRALRTNIQFSTAMRSSCPALLVTSALPAEGKTTTSTNLSVVVAQGGKRIILIDADLRRPSLHKFFGVNNDAGLTSLLLDSNLPIDAVLLETEVPGLRVIPSGPLPPNRAELLGSKAMEERLEQLKGMADIVLFDTPPVLVVADAAVLGRLCDGVILVADSHRTRSDVVRRAKENLQQLDLSILGVVLNALSPRRARGYSYVYSYTYGDEIRPGDGAAKPGNGRSTVSRAGLRWGSKAS